MKICLILLLFLIACQPAKKNLDTSKEVDHREFIKEQLGGAYQQVTNGDDRYWLCHRSGKPPHSGQVVFLVYDATDQKILYQDKLQNGHVEWENDTVVKITAGAGNRTKDYPEGYSTYYFDVKEEKIIDNVTKNN